MEQMITVTMTMSEFKSFFRKEFEDVFDEKLETINMRYTEKYLKVKDVAKALNVTERTIYNMVDRGDLQSYGQGRGLRFKESDITRYLDASK